MRVSWSVLVSAVALSGLVTGCGKDNKPEAPAKEAAAPAAPAPAAAAPAPAPAPAEMADMPTSSLGDAVNGMKLLSEAERRAVVERSRAAHEELKKATSER
jgi:pyruvate/2-oxoglutarate dehydrogenase complex dihydrolipoamide acyltransferase (E2) component